MTTRAETLDRLSRLTVHAVVVLMVIAMAFASSIDYDFLVIGRHWRFRLLAALSVLCVAYLGWRRPRLRPPAPLYVAAAALVALAYSSALWSVDAELTVSRAFTLMLLLTAGGALAYAAGGRPGVVAGILRALLAAAAIVALIGVYFLLTRRDLAIQRATLEYPARYRGMGQNPNTVPMLLAVATPLALWTAAEGRSLRRLVGLALVALLSGSIVASGSRGALFAAFVGSTMFVAALDGPWPRRLALAAVSAAALVAAAALMQIPKPLQPGPPGPARPRAAPPKDAEKGRPQAEDVGRPGESGPSPRTLLATADRARAWRGALRQAERRPVVGYGFGTEGTVFVDRYYAFYGTLPENSYVGTLLQLGLMGLTVLLAVALALAFTARRALATSVGPRRTLVAGCASTVAAGLTLGLTQSYLTSVGNVACSSVWIAGFLLAALAGQPD